MCDALALARACRGSLESAYEPLTSRPVAVALGSVTASSASPAVETTVAAIESVVRAVHAGHEALSEAGAPSESESVAGTLPPMSRPSVYDCFLPRALTSSIRKPSPGSPAARPS